LELSPYGIDVTAVMPGAVNTPGFAETLPPGLGPTKLMQPIDPSIVVNAALEGLGTKVNVHPSARSASLSRAVRGAVLGPAMALIPRKTRLKLGDKAVRQMYDR
jgi:short-subunit dehydrogenase